MITHAHRFRVIYGDTDMAGIVYYANYLRFFEAGRGELLRAFGLGYSVIEENGATLPVVEAHVKYHSPALYDDLLLLETIVEEVRRASIRVRYRLARDSDQTLIATGETLHACVGKDGRPTRLPPVVRQKLVAS